MTVKLFERLRSVLPKSRVLYVTALILAQPVIFASVLVTGLLIGVRHGGYLEELELNTFDQLIQLRPDESPDPRLLVVEVTEADLQRYGTLRPDNQTKALPDKIVHQLLNELEQNQPRVIGIDFGRSAPTGEGYADLVKHLQERDRTTVIICTFSPPSDQNISIPPPSEIPTNRIGFADFVEQPGETIRRQPLWMEPPDASVQHGCNDSSPRLHSFSLQIALHYLEKEQIQPKFTEGELKLGRTSIKPMEKNAGGYRQAKTWKHPIMLNYRSPHKVAESVTLTEVLQPQDRTEKSKQVQDRVVLIGYTAASRKDFHSTPYSRDQQQGEKMPGVLIHTQMVSQLLSAVSGDRPLIWYWSEWGEGLWIWGWSLVGGSLAWFTRRSLFALVAGGVALAALLGSCYGLFLIGGWVPLVPSALALVVTGGSVVAVAYREFPPTSYLLVRWQRSS